MNSKVSIIVAIYNIEKFIGKCIDSIINQDYKNIEIILVDDCSTDLSGKICDDYKAKDDRIHVIHHSTNTRHSIVRNDGLDKATGEYIVFVDGDDWLAPDFVTYMLTVINKTSSDMAINLVNYTSRDLQQVNDSEIQIWSAEKATAELLYPHLSIGCWNKIYRRDFIEKNKLRFRPNLFTAEGDRFINDAAQRANCVGVGCRKVYYYRLNNENSATTKYDVRQSLGAIDAFKGVEKDLIIRTPYIMKAMQHHVWINHLWNIRQILALNLKKEYKVEFNTSMKHIKQNYRSIVKNEKSIYKKTKYTVIGLFPIISAKIINYRFDTKLKKDIKNYKNIVEEKEENV